MIHGTNNVKTCVSLSKQLSGEFSSYSELSLRIYKSMKELNLNFPVHVLYNFSNSAFFGTVSVGFADKT